MSTENTQEDTLLIEFEKAYKQRESEFEKYKGKWIAFGNKEPIIGEDEFETYFRADGIYANTVFYFTQIGAKPKEMEEIDVFE